MRNSESAGNWLNSETLCRQRIKAVLIGLCLLGLLPSCSTAPITVTRLQRERVPESLLLRCPKSELTSRTYGSVIELAKKRGLELDECNSRLDAIRKWDAQ